MFISFLTIATTALYSYIVSLLEFFVPSSSSSHNLIAQEVTEWPDSPVALRPRARSEHSENSERSEFSEPKVLYKTFYSMNVPLYSIKYKYEDDEYIQISPESDVVLMETYLSIDRITLDKVDITENLIKYAGPFRNFNGEIYVSKIMELESLKSPKTLNFIDNFGNTHSCPADCNLYKLD